ncbi:MAG: hypothetical protein IJ272_05090 [Clostridia bacterium]|nr:hypothetical protein [Clostridia bacterium]
MSLDSIQMFLMALATFLGVAIGAVIVLYWQRSKGGIARKQEDEDYKKQQEDKKKAELQNAQSVKLRDFMEFDKVEDDMIVQNDGTRYVMAIR